MPRTLDPDHAFGGQTEILEINPKNAQAFYGVRMQMPHTPMLRPTFHSLVAMFQASCNCDYYITKYHAKPMAQLQSLLTNIAVALRRLEAEEEAAQAGAEQPADLPEERARRTTLKIANAANRSSWCSCCEMASFIKTGALARKTHRPITIFLSRPLYLYGQCRRLLQSSHEMLLEAQAPCDEPVRYVDVLCFTKSRSDSAVQPVELHADEANTDRAVQTVESQADAENHNEDALSRSSDESSTFDGDADTDDAAQAGPVMGQTSSSAAQPDGEANNRFTMHRRLRRLWMMMPWPSPSWRVWISQLSKPPQVLMMTGCTAVRSCSTWTSTHTFVILFESLAQKT